jgi:hypothetical protein
LPDNVTLTLLTVQNKGKNSKGEFQTNEGMEFHISGLAFGSDESCLTALALIIERLERSPLFNNVKLVSADENKLYTRPGAGFEIVCDINLANPPSPSVNLPNPPFVKGGEGGLLKGVQGIREGKQ